MDHTERPSPGGGYCSFLVRLWCDSPSTDWRASSENTLTGEKQSFASFDLLVHFLQSQTRGAHPSQRTIEVESLSFEADDAGQTADHRPQTATARVPENASRPLGWPHRSHCLDPAN